MVIGIERKVWARDMKCHVILEHVPELIEEGQMMIPEDNHTP